MEVVQTWEMPGDWQYRQGSELEPRQVFRYLIHTNIEIRVKAESLLPSKPAEPRVHETTPSLCVHHKPSFCLLLINSRPKSRVCSCVTLWGRVELRYRISGVPKSFLKFGLYWRPLRKPFFHSDIEQIEEKNKWQTGTWSITLVKTGLEDSLSWHPNGLPDTESQSSTNFLIQAHSQTTASKTVPAGKIWPMSILLLVSNLHSEGKQLKLNEPSMLAILSVLGLQTFVSVASSVPPHIRLNKWLLTFKNLPQKSFYYIPKIG